MLYSLRPAAAFLELHTLHTVGGTEEFGSPLAISFVSQGCRQAPNLFTLNPQP